MGRMKALVLSVAILFLGFGQSLAWATFDCSAALEGTLERIISQVDSSERFNVERGLPSYFDRFPTSLQSIIKYLKSGQNWMDGGSGEGWAIENYCDAYPNGANVLGITKTIKRTPKSFNGRLKVLSGRFIEDIPTSEIPVNALVTDYFGPYAYSKSPEQIIAQYVNSLQVGGKAYVYLHLKHEGSYSKVILKDGRTVDLNVWIAEKLRESGMFQVKYESQLFAYTEYVEVDGNSIRGDAEDDAITMVVDRIGAGELRLSGLRLKSVTSGTPPERIFEE